MKFLLISGAFFPGDSPRAYRTTELAKELSRMGHEVRVIAFSTNPKVNKFNYDDFTREFNITVSIIPQKWHLINSQSVVARIINRFLMQFVAYPDIEILRLLPMVFKREGKYDAMISIAVPHQIHWSLARCGKAEISKHCNTWIADCGDPFMGVKSASFKPAFYFKYIEKKWCKMCDYIAVVIESEKDNYYHDFRDKIKVIPQGIDFDSFAVENTYVPNKVPTFVYAGGFIPGIRDPRPILDYLTTIDRDFKFIIYPKDKELLLPYQVKLGGKMQIRDFIPRQELIKVISQCDFVLNIDNGVAKGSPSKLVDYAVAGRPILTLNCNSIDNNKLNQFLDGDYSQQHIIEDIDKFNIKNVAKQFVELCNKK